MCESVIRWDVAYERKQTVCVQYCNHYCIMEFFLLCIYHCSKERDFYEQEIYNKNTLLWSCSRHSIILTRISFIQSAHRSRQYVRISLAHPIVMADCLWVPLPSATGIGADVVGTTMFSALGIPGSRLAALVALFGHPQSNFKNLNKYSSILPLSLHRSDHIDGLNSVGKLLSMRLLCIIGSPCRITVI